MDNEKPTRRTCTKCKINKEDSAFYFHKRDGRKRQCKDCCRRYQREHKREYRRIHGRKKISPATARKYWLKRKDGLTEKQWLELFRQQNGKCAVCGAPHLEFKKGLCIDHNHKTGNVWGLLCVHCNTLVGHAQEDVNILNCIIRYLGSFQAVPVKTADTL